MGYRYHLASSVLSAPNKSIPLWLGPSMPSVSRASRWLQCWHDCKGSKREKETKGNRDKAGKKKCKRTVHNTRGVLLPKNPAQRRKGIMLCIYLSSRFVLRAKHRKQRVGRQGSGGSRSKQPPPKTNTNRTVDDDFTVTSLDVVPLRPGGTSFSLLAEAKNGGFLRTCQAQEFSGLPSREPRKRQSNHSSIVLHGRACQQPTKTLKPHTPREPDQKTK